MYKTKLLIFDCDGTLLDTTKPGQAKIPVHLKKMELPTVDPEFVRIIWGAPYHKIALEVCRAAGAPDRAHEFIELEHKSEDGDISLCPDLPFILSELRRTSYLAIITSRSKQSFDKIITQTNLYPGLFDFIQTGDDYEYLKPDSRVFDPILKWAKSRQIVRNKITYFGDTVDYDWAAAKGVSGLNFVGVCSGASKSSEFLKAGVTNILYNVSGLTEHLRQQLQFNTEPSFSQN